MNVTVLFDDDQESPAGLPGTEARVDVLRVVDAVRGELAAAGHRASTRALGPDFTATLRGLRDEAPDVVFNLCESLRGDARGEAVVAGVLEQLGLCFTGSPSLALGLALHKDLAKGLLRGCGVPTPDWLFLPQGAADIPEPADYPVIVKPAHEDGSIGIGFGSVASSGEALRQAVHRVWRMGQPALVERFVDGREFCVSLLGNTPCTVLPLREISFGPTFADRPRIVSYVAKWDPTAPEFQDTVSAPSDLPAGAQARMIDAARRAFEALGCRDYGRVDLRLDAEGVPWIIDVNPNCDLHPEAGFARAARSAGLTYAALVGRLLENALERSPRDPAHRAAAPGEPGGAPPADDDLHTG